MTIGEVLVLIGILAMVLGPFILTKITKIEDKKVTSPNPEVDYDNDWGENMNRRMKKIQNHRHQAYDAPRVKSESTSEDETWELTPEWKKSNTSWESSEEPWDHYSDPEQIANTKLNDAAVTKKKAASKLHKIDKYSRLKQLMIYKEILDKPLALRDQQGEHF